MELHLLPICKSTVSSCSSGISFCRLIAFLSFITWGKAKFSFINFISLYCECSVRWICCIIWIICSKIANDRNLQNVNVFEHFGYIIRQMFQNLWIIFASIVLQTIQIGFGTSAISAFCKNDVLQMLQISFGSYATRPQKIRKLQPTPLNMRVCFISILNRNWRLA